MSKIKALSDQLNTHPWVTDTSYEVITGSVSYGLENVSSDLDIVGIVIPPIDIVFPSNYVRGFGLAPENFESYQKHHIFDKQGRECDVAIYSIVKFFSICAEMNPNAIDYLYVHDRHILHIDDAGKLMRQYRKSFLNKNCIHRYLNYAISQLKKAEDKNPSGKRKEIVEKFGMDVKFLYHVVRLVNECEMILMEEDLDLERNNEILKSIRRGERTIDEIKDLFKQKEQILNELYLKSKLPEKPDYEFLKRILIMCIEQKYGSVDKYVNMSTDLSIMRKYEEIKRIINS